MRRFHATAALIFSFAVTLAAARAGAAPAASAKPFPPGLDEAALDPSVNPCDDFYQYACGGWLKASEIPPERSCWSRGFAIVAERNRQTLREILGDIAAGRVPEGTPYAKKIGDFYGACLDEPQLEQALPRLQAELARIQVGTPQQLAATLARLHADGARVPFLFESAQDFQDATRIIGQLDQAGLGLPDRDYYLLDGDAQKNAVRVMYRQHAQDVFTLLGQPPEQAKASAAALLDLETKLAAASLSKVDRREPARVYHPMDVKGLKTLAPEIDWDGYFRAAGVPSPGKINVKHPPFLAEVSRLVKAVPAKQWAAYFAFHLVEAATPALPKRFQDESFAFNSKALTGAQEDQPRWKKCVGFVDEALGEAVAVPFVARTFGADGKAKALEMVFGIEAAFERNLDSLAWMDGATKARALEKVRKINNKIGYPDRWRSYDGLKVDRGSFLTSLLEANAFETARRLAKIGKPLDRTEWLITPPTVNAYYESSMNEVTFPAGILQPPFFDRAAPPPVNFGGIGMVVGHEFTHGFDDEGRLFDADGNLKTWWSDTSNKLFVERAACVRRQFDGYTAVDDIKVNGALTLGENVADLGGLKLAHAAMLAWAEKHPEQANAYRLTPSQQFFIGYAQSWCEKVRPEYARVLAQTDPHSPASLRVNGPLRNLDAFRKAFACPTNARMVWSESESCQVW